ncbi:HNH endonuclease [Cupriavidus sp. WGlv3]|uniref:HNH endonuclease signature motif containing protein n=1 Tax=Cupriavidus sp. WGlv3 TaxID=2919924 RepID=UPI0020912AF3|nr:HNH endonuclease signature motif containing protein [Cupriavidus sp. WGlv3]MCO4862858.1 HNH endonuclease [Cupriavidus sp. WGlv3]
MDDGWSDAELAASVGAYKKMAQSYLAGQRVNKSAIYRELEGQFGRSAKAFERRMQNISAVLRDLGSGWVPGLMPAKHVGPNVQPRIVALLDGFKIRDINSTRNAATAVEVGYSPELSVLRDWLIAVARHRRTVTPLDTMAAFGMSQLELHRAIEVLGRESRKLREPIITALLVKPEDGQCVVDLVSEFGVKSNDGERRRLYAYWKRTEIQPAPESAAPVRDLKSRAAQFVSVEVRPDQAVFRRRIFEACQGRCVVSGCDVVRALDAAHLRGRNWRLGHNDVTDGVLLRKDLHALYDCRLLWFTDDGHVGLHPTVRDCYREYDGVGIRLPAV